VENYMIEIARNYKVEYDPDPTMFMVRNGKVVIYTLGFVVPTAQ